VLVVVEEEQEEGEEEEMDIEKKVTKECSMVKEAKVAK
jgi:hypothetical protein